MADTFRKMQKVQCLDGSQHGNRRPYGCPCCRFVADGGKFRKMSRKFARAKLKARDIKEQQLAWNDWLGSTQTDILAEIYNEMHSDYDDFNTYYDWCCDPEENEENEEYEDDCDYPESYDWYYEHDYDYNY